MADLASWLDRSGSNPEGLAKRSRHSAHHVMALFEQPEPNPSLRLFLDLVKEAGAQFASVAADEPIAVITRLKEIISREKLSVSVLATLSGMNRTSVSTLLNDPTPNPTLATIDRLVHGLGAESDFRITERSLVGAMAVPADDRPPQGGHTESMKFLDQFRTDLKKATEDAQRALVVEVLKRRAGNLTLGDLRELLSSPLGNGLDDVAVASLLGTQVNLDDSNAAKGHARKVSKAKAGRAEAGEPRTGKAKVGKARARNEPKARKAAVVQASAGTAKAGKAKAKVGKVKAGKAQAASQGTAATAAPTDAQLDVAVTDALKNGPASSSVIQKAVGGSIDRIRSALHRLVDAGQVTRTGERKLTRYALK